MYQLKEYIDRLFLIYGNVRDEYILPDNRTVPLDRYLDLYLREHLDYEAIIFLDNKGLYSFDPKSFQLSVKTIKKKTTNKNFSKLKRPKNNIVIDYTAQKSTEVNETKLRRSYNGDINEILAFIMYHIKRSDLKIAFIVYEGSLFAKLPVSSDIWIQFQGLLRNEILQLDSSNRNIFIWADGEALTTLSDRFVNLGLDFFFSLKDNQERSFGIATLINISYPKKDEILQALIMRSLETGVYPDYSQLEKNAPIISGELFQKEESLKKFRQYLNTDADFWDYITQEYNLKDDETPAIEELKNMVGMGSVFQEIKRIIYGLDKKERTYEADYNNTPERFLKPQAQSLSNIPHLALLGNPGTGKTTVARLIGRILKEEGILESGQLIEVSRQDLVAGYVGQTALKVGEQVAKAMGGILFIDEAYSLVTGDGNDFGQEALATLVKAMSDYQGAFMVIFAGYRDETLEMFNRNPGTNRRVTNIYLPDYNKDDLAKIMLGIMERSNLPVAEDVKQQTPLFCENLLGNRDKFGGNHFGNAGVIVQQFAIAEQNAKVEGAKSIQTSHFKYPEYFKLMEAESEDLENLIGLTEIKQKLNNLSKRLRIEKSIYPGHYVFTGNPGTGKTIVARQMAKRFYDLGLIESNKINPYTASQLISAQRSGANADINKILRESLGGVLFIDEAHQLAGDSALHHNFGKTILDAIVPFMENNKENFSLILAGYPQQIDEMLATDPGLRGRFNEVFAFPDYTAEEMVQIFFKLFKEQNIYKLDNHDAEYLSSCFCRIREREGYSFSNARTVRLFIEKITSEAITDSESTAESVLIREKHIKSVVDGWK